MAFITLYDSHNVYLHSMKIDVEFQQEPPVVGLYHGRRNLLHTSETKFGPIEETARYSPPAVLYAGSRCALHGGTYST
jgi:hypothetical protein